MLIIRLADTTHVAITVFEISNFNLRLLDLFVKFSSAEIYEKNNMKKKLFISRVCNIEFLGRFRIML